MENLVSSAKSYFDFVLNQKEYRSPEYFLSCLADVVVNYWRTLLFVNAEDLDHDDAAKAEEALIYSVTNGFSDVEKLALQKAAKVQAIGKFGTQEIDPEDESQNREWRFLSFIASGRFEDMDLL